MNFTQFKAIISKLITTEIPQGISVKYIVNDKVIVHDNFTTIENLYDKMFPHDVLGLKKTFLNEKLNSIEVIKNDETIKAIIIDDNEKHILTSSIYTPEIITDIRMVNNLLSDKIKKNPKDIHKLTSREFEQFAAELLEKNGYEVKLTQQTRDGGKDIIVIQKGLVGTFLTYVECKKFAPDNHVGVKLIRELYGTVTHDRATSGMFITSSYFSKDAYEFTETIKHQMELVDFNNLSELLINIK